MPVERPTFSESWYRVTDLKPRLRTSVQTFRQHFRGQAWHVVRDPSNNQFFRLDDAGYYFVGLLDGRRTVAQAWKMSGDKLGDRAPTQGEAIRLLGQLYAANLLQADWPPDAEGMFERYRQRRHREMGGYFMNLLFPRFPLLNPERFLEAFVGVVGWVFSWPGLILWCVLLGAGFWGLTGQWDKLFTAGRAGSLLQTENLVLLYVAFAIIKTIHEFGHAFACKKFGTSGGRGTGGRDARPTRSGGGEVHTMGVMLLVLVPTPYVDASSAWAFRSKWQRAIVGAAGMYVELAVAAVAAIIWANSAPGVGKDIAFNAMFIASVSTVLFNANPLLRYDGYYILSDLLEIPNLAQRGKEYLYYLVRWYIFGVRQAVTPTATRRERGWLVVYAIASGIYRVFVSVMIVLYIGDKLFIVGAIMAAAAVIGWVCVPAWKYLQYLLTGPELMRVRMRAIAVTAGVVVVAVGVVGLIPMPDRGRAEGVVEPRNLAVIYMPADGFIDAVLPTNTMIGGDGLAAAGPAGGGSGARLSPAASSDAGGDARAPTGQPLVTASNPLLIRDRDQTRADRELILLRRNQVLTRNPAYGQDLDQQLEAVTNQLARLDERVESLNVRSPLAVPRAVWIAAEEKPKVGAFVHQGEKLGLVADTEHLFIRIVADQYLGPRIAPEIGIGKRVELRVEGQPDLRFTAVIEEVVAAGQKKLPSAALGYQAGGATAVAADDPHGTTAEEGYFEVRLRPETSGQYPGAGTAGGTPAPPNQGVRLMSGQRVMVRFEFPARPLAVQWWRSLRQLVQRRYQV